MNIFLDLDNTILSSEEKNKIDPNIFSGNDPFYVLNKNCYEFDPYIIFERPNLDIFLDFLFKNFNVSIWTAATKDYAMFIIKKVILKKKNYNLKTILFYENTNHVDCKDLSYLWNVWECKEFNKHNTIIIDDLEQVCKKNYYNHININYFDYKNIKDDELNTIMDILKNNYLK